MAVAFIGIGSNIAPLENITAAIERLGEKSRLTGISPFYWNAAIDKNGAPSGQPLFLNGVCRLETAMPMQELKTSVLQRIETQLGRIRTGDKFANRPIDLDILLYGAVSGEEVCWMLLDKDVFCRPFVAKPLYDVAGNLWLAERERWLEEVVAEMSLDSLSADDSLFEQLSAKLRATPPEYI